MGDGVSLGRGAVLHDTGKAIKVELDGRAEPLWVPKWAVHEDSEIWTGGQEPGELVVSSRFADQEDLEPVTASSPSARELERREAARPVDHGPAILQEVQALRAEVGQLRELVFKLAATWEVEP